MTPHPSEGEPPLVSEDEVTEDEGLLDFLPRWAIALSVLVALVLAGIGVALYVDSPGVASYNASSLLVLPLLLLALYWLHGLLPIRVQWVGAVALAVVGPVGYLVVGGDQWWNWGQYSAVPLLMLIFSRLDESRDSDRPGWGGVADGPWGPP